MKIHIRDGLAKVLRQLQDWVTPVENFHDYRFLLSGSQVWLRALYAYYKETDKLLAEGLIQFMNDSDTDLRAEPRSAKKVTTPAELVIIKKEFEEAINKRRTEIAQESYAGFQKLLIDEKIRLNKPDSHIENKTHRSVRNNDLAADLSGNTFFDENRPSHENDFMEFFIKKKEIILYDLHLLDEPKSMENPVFIAGMANNLKFISSDKVERLNLHLRRDSAEKMLSFLKRENRDETQPYKEIMRTYKKIYLKNVPYKDNEINTMVHRIIKLCENSLLVKEMAENEKKLEREIKKEQKAESLPQKIKEVELMVANELIAIEKVIGPLGMTLRQNEALQSAFDQCQIKLCAFKNSGSPSAPSLRFVELQLAQLIEIHDELSAIHERHESLLKKEKLINQPIKSEATKSETSPPEPKPNNNKPNNDKPNNDKSKKKTKQQNNKNPHHHITDKEIEEALQEIHYEERAKKYEDIFRSNVDRMAALSDSIEIKTQKAISKISPAEVLNFVLDVLVEEHSGKAAGKYMHQAVIDLDKHYTEKSKDAKSSSAYSIPPYLNQRVNSEKALSLPNKEVKAGFIFLSLNTLFQFIYCPPVVLEDTRPQEAVNAIRPQVKLYQQQSISLDTLIDRGLSLFINSRYENLMLELLGIIIFSGIESLREQFALIINKEHHSKTAPKEIATLISLLCSMISIFTEESLFDLDPIKTQFSLSITKKILDFPRHYETFITDIALSSIPKLQFNKEITSIFDESQLYTQKVACEKHFLKTIRNRPDTKDLIIKDIVKKSEKILTHFMLLMLATPILHRESDDLIFRKLSQGMGSIKKYAALDDPNISPAALKERIRKSTEEMISILGKIDLVDKDKPIVKIVHASLLQFQESFDSIYDIDSKPQQQQDVIEASYLSAMQMRIDNKLFSNARLNFSDAPLQLKVIAPNVKPNPPSTPAKTYEELYNDPDKVFLTLADKVSKDQMDASTDNHVLLALVFEQLTNSKVHHHVLELQKFYNQTLPKEKDLALYMPPTLMQKHHLNEKGALKARDKKILFLFTALNECFVDMHSTPLPEHMERFGRLIQDLEPILDGYSQKLITEEQLIKTVVGNTKALKKPKIMKDANMLLLIGLVNKRKALHTAIIANPAESKQILPKLAAINLLIKKSVALESFNGITKSKDYNTIFATFFSQAVVLSESFRKELLKIQSQIILSLMDSSAELPAVFQRYVPESFNHAEAIHISNPVRIDAKTKAYSRTLMSHVSAGLEKHFIILGLCVPYYDEGAVEEIYIRDITSYMTHLTLTLHTADKLMDKKSIQSCVIKTCEELIATLRELSEEQPGNLVYKATLIALQHFQENYLKIYGIEMTPPDNQSWVELDYSTRLLQKEDFCKLYKEEKKKRQAVSKPLLQSQQGKSLNPAPKSTGSQNNPDNTKPNHNPPSAPF